MLEIKLLPFVKNLNITKEEWEKYKKDRLEDIEEVDKYFEELEKKRPKLTIEEKAYLSAVIKPFRDEVDFIILEEAGQRNNMAYITIDLGRDEICLPLFEKGKYYQGLELEREYDLEELGL